MAAVSRTSPISGELGLVAELIAQNISPDGLRLSSERADGLLKRLDLIKRQIANLEHELGAFRADEQDSAAAGVIGDLCLDVMRDGVLDAAQGAPVAYPDFKKGKRS